MSESVNLNWARLVAYLVARANEASTWAGLVLFLSGCGVAIGERWSLIIGGLGVAAAGALRALLPNHLGGGDLAGKDKA
jgi:hypothetical protein